MSDLYQHKINNDYYWFKINLWNDNNKEQTISPAAIKSLVIEDNFYNFFHKGYIIIDNRYDAIERSVGENVQIADQSPSFIFMGDARDYLNIEIYPLGENKVLERKELAMSTRIYFQASIYAIEEIATDTPDVKFKKLYFWDRYYQILREKNTYWSTADVVENRIEGNESDVEVIEKIEDFAASIQEIKSLNIKNVSNFDNLQRAIPTGEAIKKFLATVFVPEDGYPIAFAGEDFADTGSYTLDPAIRANDPTWDVGATVIYYSTPAQFKAIDTLLYLLDHHVSTPESFFDQCFLRIDRGTRVFTLRPLSNYFKAAYGEGDVGGPLYIETILLGGLGYPDGSTSRYSRVSDFTPKLGRFQLQQIGTTSNFELEPSLGSITQRDFNSKAMHHYRRDDKEFVISNQENNIAKIISVYQQNYVDTIQPRLWSSIVPGFNRTTNKNIDHRFSDVVEDDRQIFGMGRNQALYTAIFANNQVKFRVPGSTVRQAGKFIGVDRDGSSPANEYDQKALGIYFITEVKHIFEGNNYYNELTCVKTYTTLQIYNGQIGPGNQNINNQTSP